MKKRRGKGILIVVVIIMVLTMTGCTGVQERATEEVEAYNKEVERVVRQAYEIEQTVKERTEEILEELGKTEGEIDGVKIEGEYVIEGLTEIDILRNEFFTSINAKSVRNVMYITQGSEAMYVELIWGEKGLEQARRMKHIRG